MQVFRFFTIIKFRAIYFSTSLGHYWPLIDKVGFTKKSQNCTNQGSFKFFCLLVEGSESGAGNRSVQKRPDPVLGGPKPYGSLSGTLLLALIFLETKIISTGSHTAKTKCRKLEMKIPRKGISGPQSQFPHSCVCERIIYSHEGYACSAGGNM